MKQYFLGNSEGTDHKVRDGVENYIPVKQVDTQRGKEAKEELCN
jgi:hypothetical protein